VFDDPRPEDGSTFAEAEPPAAPSGRSNWHGRIARDAQGRRIIWQEPPNGNGGRFVQLNEATASNQAREALANERARLGTLTRTAPLAEEYIVLNRTTPTGSWGARSFDRERRAQASDEGALWHGLNMPTQFEPNREGLERMATLEDQALRGNIPQGGAQTANSAFEQQVLRGLFPTLTALGNVNMTNAATLLAERDLQRHRVAAMERWLTEHQDFGNFESSWATYADQQRPRLIEQYRAHLQRPSLGQPQENDEPAVGTRRTFRNGAVGEWDGNGWRQVQAPQQRR